MIPNAITSSATLQSLSSMAEFSSKEEREDSLSLIIGIASLVLEGRPIGDEYETLPQCNSKVPSSTLPCTSRVQVAKNTMSNALNKTSQKLYQLRQAENGVGRKGTWANHQYSMQSIPNNFNEENDCSDRTKSINDDYSGFLYTLQSLASSCLQSGQSATMNTSLGQTVHNDATEFSETIDENNPHSSRERYCSATSNIDMKTFLVGCKSVNHCVASKVTNNEFEAKRSTQRLPMPSLLPAQLQQGPHCDLFLKKIGLCKAETTENYEHYCDMSYLNITCSRWKAYCLKIEAIIKRGLPVCIEVYLGPVSHKILLEQWILQMNERAISPTMTLPSLCSAIRSQLYFSQISAWCDLIKKCENSVKESGRVIFGRSNNSAGDLIQTPQINFTSTIPSTPSHPFSKVRASVTQRPRLNIFYRLKAYDSTASFISKPRVHNFPNVNVTENFSISVCLKSLPRLNGGIPKVGKLPINLIESTSPEFINDKKNTATSCTISNSNSFKNTATLEKPPPIASNTSNEQSTKICDKTMFNPTITLEDYINTGSKDKSTNSQNSSDDNNVFLFKTQNYYDLKSESDCSNSLDGLSHREKQLLKYKKRMQKRDKQLRSYFKNTNPCFTQCALPINQYELDGGNNRNLFQNDVKIANSNFKESGTSEMVTKVSIGTQTQHMCCKYCGNEKSLLCLTCENHFNNTEPTDETDIELMKISSNKSMVNNNEENKNSISKRELLLQAIQCTPQSLRLKKKCPSADPIFTIKSGKSQQNNNSESSNSTITKKSCRLCKRQKTQHTYIDKIEDTASAQCQDQTNLLGKLEIGKNNFENSDVSINDPIDSSSCKQNFAQYENRLLEPVFKTPTEDEQHTKNNENRIHTINNSIDSITEKLNDKFSQNLLVARLKNSSEHQESTPITMCNKSKIVRKSVPKINLTPIFCKSQTSISEQYWKSITSPVSIDLKDVPSSSKTAYQKIENSAKIQKSNSAPTLPNTLTVSPRYPKQLHANKGRSRHISDRSDRSSLCSDEMFSDEECESYVYSPSTSPNKKRYNYFSLNRRLPLLGNLEESLLQKRFIPKMEVVGFKVLLGASGGFCPTQLTIPASSYFYELQSEDISTPYICEIRLPRKGYVVPRSGTVQVTLLNPTGTVVRMFVVPYDMRDMPPLHTTFVRQRILADTNTNSSNNSPTPSKDNRPVVDNDDKIYFRSSTNNNQNYEREFGYFISPEHMKRLRYCIHLKFQTSRSGRLLLHTDIRLLISRRTDCDTAIAHAKGALESSSDLVIQTFMPENPTYSMRQENLTKL